MKKNSHFAMLPIALLKSPAMRALSRAAMLVLMRIEIELDAHKGRDNGALPITYADFEAFGIHPDSIAPALRELHALGITTLVPGSGGRAARHAPNLHGVTYRSMDGAPPTNAWDVFKAIGEAGVGSLACALPALVYGFSRKHRH